MGFGFTGLTLGSITVLPAILFFMEVLRVKMLI
jgi:hypothetical protein